MDRVQHFLGLGAGHIERKFGQPGHGEGHGFERRMGFTVQAQQAFKHQLAGDPQGAGGPFSGKPKGLVELGDARQVRRAGAQKGQVGRVAAPDALGKT